MHYAKIETHVSDDKTLILIITLFQLRYLLKPIILRKIICLYLTQIHGTLNL